MVLIISILQPQPTEKSIPTIITHLIIMIHIANYIRVDNNIILSLTIIHHDTNIIHVTYHHDVSIKGNNHNDVHNYNYVNDSCY